MATEKKHMPLGVTRIEVSSSHRAGWMARVQRGDVRYNEYYADQDCGGSRKAAAVRQVWRWPKQLPAPMDVSHRGEVGRRNKSGMVTVHKRTYAPRDKPHLEYEFWIGTCHVGRGRRRNKSFSCHKFTDRGAKRLAKIARGISTGEMDAIPVEYRQRHGKHPDKWKN